MKLFSHVFPLRFFDKRRPEDGAARRRGGQKTGQPEDGAARRRGGQKTGRPEEAPQEKRERELLLDLARFARFNARQMRRTNGRMDERTDGRTTLLTEIQGRI